MGIAENCYVCHGFSPFGTHRRQPVDSCYYRRIFTERKPLQSASFAKAPNSLSSPHFSFCTLQFSICTFRFSYLILFSALSAPSAVNRSPRHLPLDSMRTNVLSYLPKPYSGAGRLWWTPGNRDLPSLLPSVSTGGATGSTQSHLA